GAGFLYPGQVAVAGARSVRGSLAGYRRHLSGGADRGHPHQYCSVRQSAGVSAPYPRRADLVILLRPDSGVGVYRRTGGPALESLDLVADRPECCVCLRDYGGGADAVVLGTAV